MSLLKILKTHILCNILVYEEWLMSFLDTPRLNSNSTLCLRTTESLLFKYFQNMKKIFKLLKEVQRPPEVRKQLVEFAIKEAAR